MLFSAVTLAAGLFGIGIVCRYEAESFEKNLWASFRARNDLFRTAVLTAVARSSEIVLLSRLEQLMTADAPEHAVLAELQRMRRVAAFSELTSLKVLDAHGAVRARLGADSYNNQFSVRLPASMAHSAQLFWSNGWRLMMTIPLSEADGGARAVVEVALYRFDRDVAQMQDTGVSTELRICTIDGRWMRCFPSKLLQQASSFSLSPSPDSLVMHYALTGMQGVAIQRDYRDKEVIAAFGQIESLGLGLVQKIDAAEAYRPISRRLMLSLAVLLLLIAGSALLIYWRMRPLVSGLADAHARLDALLNNVPAGVIVLDSQDQVLTANRAAEQLFQKQADGLNGMHAGRLLAPRSNEGTPIPGGMQETLVDLPDGTCIWLQFTATDVLQGMEATRIVILQDLTQRRKMESLLEKWGHVFRHAEWGMAIGSPDGGTIDMVNPAFARMYGYTVEELRGRAVDDLLVAESRSALAARIKATNDMGSNQYASVHQRKDGSIFPVWVNLNLVRDELGGPLYHAVNVIDISERERLTQDLRQNELLLRQILEALPVGVWVADAQGLIAIANPANEQIWGSKLPGHSCALDSPRGCRMNWHNTQAPLASDQSAIMLALEQGKSLFNQIVTLEGPHGICKTIRYSVVPLQRGETGEPTAVVVSEDISQSSQAELALRRSEAGLANAQRLAHIGSWERELATGKQYWSDEIFRICEMPVGAAPPDFPAQLEFVPAADRQLVRERIEAASSGATPYDITYQVVLPSGGRKVLHSRAQLECDAAGKAVRLLGTLQDITEKTRAEELLRKREEEFRALVENSPDVIIRFDRQHRCVYVNPAIERAAKLEPGQLIGRKLSDIRLFGTIANQAKAALDRVFSTASNDSLEFSVSVTARARHYQVMLVPEFRREGDVLTVLAMARDVSAIKRDAEALRQSRQLLRDLSAHMEQVREEERKAIAREVHDELGQALTALRMDLSLLRLQHGDNNPPLVERIASMKESIDRTIHIVRHVSSALRPVALDLGLTAALEWLVEDFRHRSGIACHLHTGPHDVVLDDSKATALFRIVQESLTNVLKHAAAAQVAIYLHTNKDEVQLEIRDDGIGFSSMKPPHFRAFGLVGMRERALKLGGRVDISSAPGSGTRVTVGLPLADAGSTTDNEEQT